MKKKFVAMLCSGLCGVFGLSVALTAGPAFGASEVKTSDLIEIIGTLNVEQQAALLLLLNAMTASTDEAVSATSQGAKEALMAAMETFNKAKDTGDVDLTPFFASISEDFHHWGVNGKAGAVQWVQSISGSLFRNGEALIEFDLKDVEVEEDGDTAVAYPIYVDTPLGSVTLEISAAREADGVWRMTGVDGI